MQREVSLQDCFLANCLHTKPCVISRFFEHIFAFFVHATSRLPRSSSATNTAPRPPAQRIDHQHSTSTIRTAHRPPTQHIDHRAASRPPAQRIVHPRHPLTSPSRPIEQIFALFLSAQGQNSAITHCFT